ncbi:MAG: DUF3089 domain-containing protein [Bacteroidia bacterium]
MKNKVFLAFFVLMLCGCLKPWHSFDEYMPPPAPDYSKEDSWASLPWLHDAADTVPPGSGLTDNQANAKVDVFYIYPTLDIRIDQWNADIHSRLLNGIIDWTAIREQAGLFNGSCRIFAPRYRQAVFGSFLDEKGDGAKALDLAYSDVKAAFLYYMKHYNNGRPVIIAGHSQGCLHGYHLIKEFFDTTSLKQKLVAAYLVGFKINKDSLKYLKPCDSAKETGCYVSWNTVSEDGQDGMASKYFRGVCINPLSWKQDTNYISAAYNLGSVPFNFKKIDTNETGAACRNGLLVVNIRNPWKYSSVAGSYHIFDFNLFYMNIRANIAERVGEYLKLHGDSLRN